VDYAAAAGEVIDARRSVNSSIRRRAFTLMEMLVCWESSCSLPDALSRDHAGTAGGGADEVPCAGRPTWKGAGCVRGFA